MMGTLATGLAKKGIDTNGDFYHTEIEGDIENVNGVLKITEIRVDYHLTTTSEKAQDARDVFGSYITNCPAAQSVIGCISIKDNLILHKKE